MKSHSSSNAQARKPHADFPLFPHHGTNRWAKKVRGKRHYFGPITGDENGRAALKRWLDQKDDLLAGRTPRAKLDGFTVADLCNKFLGAKRTQLDLGKLSPRSFFEYTRTTYLIVDAFGRNRNVDDLRPEDFEQLYQRLTRKHGLTTLGREITMVRSIFRYGVENDHIERAIKFGSIFKAPSKADKRKHKARQKHSNGARMFSADEINSMLNAAGPQLKAMILLGINGGLGNTDCSSLPMSAL